MALRTDMWLDAVDDYAKAYDKGVDAELENMKTGASLESWTGKMQELKEACICMPRHFLMCWLAARSLGKDLFSDETYKSSKSKSKAISNFLLLLLNFGL